MSEKEVSRVSVKAPPFWKDNVELWFANIESQFTIAGITVDETKFHHLVASLDSELSSYVGDIIKNPPKENGYMQLKQRLIAQFTESETIRVKTLLSDMLLGDLKPSQLLLKMTQLNENRLSEDILKMLWLQRLPLHLQHILSASGDKLDALASIADKVYEISSVNPSVSGIQTEDDRFAKLEKKIELLTNTVQKLSHRGRSQARFPFRRNRSKSPFFRPGNSNFSQKSKVCWYHSTFKEKAVKCTKPCEYPEN